MSLIASISIIAAQDRRGIVLFRRPDASSRTTNDCAAAWLELLSVVCPHSDVIVDYHHNHGDIISVAVADMIARPAARPIMTISKPR